MTSRIAFAAGFALASVLYVFPACGGGSSDSPTPPAAPTLREPLPTDFADSADHYFTPLFPQPTHGVIVTLNGGEIYSEWNVRPLVAQWGDDLEFFSVRECNGVKYYWLDAFGKASTGARYPLEHVIDKVTPAVGPTLDLAQLCPGQMGASYIPMILPATGSITVEQWFWIREPPRPAYYKTRFTFGESLDNPCWRGTGPTTRPVIKQEEVWWDETGWSRGTPLVAGATPWVNRIPHDIEIAYGQVTYIGRDAGPLWRGRAGLTELCLRST